MALGETWPPNPASSVQSLPALHTHTPTWIPRPGTKGSFRPSLSLSAVLGRQDTEDVASGKGAQCSFTQPHFGCALNWPVFPSLCQRVPSPNHQAAAHTLWLVDTQRTREGSADRQSGSEWRNRREVPQTRYPQGNGSHPPPWCSTTRA